MILAIQRAEQKYCTETVTRVLRVATIAAAAGAAALALFAGATYVAVGCALFGIGVSLGWIWTGGKLLADALERGGDLRRELGGVRNQLATADQLIQQGHERLGRANVDLWVARRDLEERTNALGARRRENEALQVELAEVRQVSFETGERLRAAEEENRELREGEEPLRLTLRLAEQRLELMAQEAERLRKSVVRGEEASRVQAEAIEKIGSEVALLNRRLFLEVFGNEPSFQEGTRTAPRVLFEEDPSPFSGIVPPLSARRVSSQGAMEPKTPRSALRTPRPGYEPQSAAQTDAMIAFHTQMRRVDSALKLLAQHVERIGEYSQALPEFIKAAETMRGECARVAERALAIMQTKGEQLVRRGSTAGVSSERSTI